MDVSGNGRFVAFVTDNNDLVPGDAPRVGAPDWDVFVTDRQTGEVELISISLTCPPGQPCLPGNGESWKPSISDDGRFVAFLSFANDLVSDDTNHLFPDPRSGLDVFVRDRQNQTTVRVTGRQATNPNEFPDNPAVSGNGAFVAYESTFLFFCSGQEACERVTIYRDSTTVPDPNTRIVVPVVRAGLPATWQATIAGDSRVPAISADGRYVAFMSEADGLDRQDGTITDSGFLAEAGWARGWGQLLVSGYDWRLSNVTSATNLRQCIIERWGSEVDVPQIEIVAHSMGGLVARRYALDHPNTVRRIVYMGTPHEGAASAIPTLATGELGNWLLDSLSAMGDSVRALTANWPGMHQLLPTAGHEEPLVFWFAPQQSNGLSLSRNQALGLVPLPLDMARRDAAQRLLVIPNVGLTVEADIFHGTISGSVTAVEHVIVGRGRPTPTRYFANYVQPRRLGSLTENLRLERLPADGDGTVTEFSASRGIPPGLPDFRRDVEGVVHNRMGSAVNQPEIGDHVQDFLTQTSSSSPSPPASVARITLITLYPGQMKATDSLGQVTGRRTFDGQDIRVREIPFSEHGVYVGNEEIVLPLGDTYNVTISKHTGQLYGVIARITSAAGDITDEFAITPTPIESSGLVSFTVLPTGIPQTAQRDPDGTGSQLIPDSWRNLPVFEDGPVSVTIEAGEVQTDYVQVIKPRDRPVEFSIQAGPSDLTVNEEASLTIGGAVGSYSGEVKVIDPATGVFDVLSFPITITPSTCTLAVTSPAGGSFTAGTEVPVAWTGTPVTGPRVRIVLLQGGVEQRTLSASELNTGSFTWTVPADVPAGSYTIRVEDASDGPGCGAESAVFTIQPTVTWITPPPAVTFIAPFPPAVVNGGDPITVHWRLENFTDVFQMEIRPRSANRRSAPTPASRPRPRTTPTATRLPRRT